VQSKFFELKPDRPCNNIPAA